MTSGIDTAKSNYVEILDIPSGSITNATAGLYPFLDFGFTAACLIPLPENDAFVITGGEKLMIPK